MLFVNAPDLIVPATCSFARGEAAPKPTLPVSAVKIPSRPNKAGLVSVALAVNSLSKVTTIT